MALSTFSVFLVALFLAPSLVSTGSSRWARQDSTPVCGIGARNASDPRAAFFRGIVDTSHYGNHERVASPAGVPLKIGIVGAGAAGLYAAMLLDSLGIDYDIYEASSRIGGRIYTYRFSESTDPSDPAYYDYYVSDK